MYKDDNNGGLYHHHEQWVLDDGTLSDTLPGDPSGGGMGNSQAEKPWAIILFPYFKNRQAAFCPADPTKRSADLTDNMLDYNGGITDASISPPPNSELGIADTQHLAVESYLLDSIYTHKSARYAIEGVLYGFATDNVIATISHQNIIMFSERNSEALDAPDNSDYASIEQDDYDTWGGEAQLVQWGTGPYADQGWVRYNRHVQGANYVYNDGHVIWQHWKTARFDQFPDGVVRFPLNEPPQ
jgi:prepilin-type processing-associated H-X9-DG protein